ncbi:MAG: NAD kinase [Alphaproteobacteria bacterium]
MTDYTNLAIVASPNSQTQAARQRLEQRYGARDPASADIIVALGGDGLMLRSLHEFMALEKPIFGMNFGSVGFLMNDLTEDNLPDRLAQAVISRIHPLRMRATDIEGQVHERLAINEVSLFRTTYQAGKLQIAVNGKVRMAELICDGALVSTPAGSTAYNLSAHGPILPLEAKLLALTPISAFRPRRWRGALLDYDAVITFEVLNATDRLMNAAADHFEVAQVAVVEIDIDRTTTLELMFDPGHSLDERILQEQFQF